jgi:hypothetical protein
MRQTWHIFKKDVRRLWWMAAVTLGLLAWLAHMDRWRSQWTPGSSEGWLNFLLPFAWAYLTGILILQDPLVGDREFWLALPCRRGSLLGAKALFLLAFIHAPYFVAQSAILLGRGFSPLAYLPHLLWKQLLLLLAITLPAAAAAALVENVVQFTLAAVLLIMAAVFVSARALPTVAAWNLADTPRRDFVILIVGAGALAALLRQYGRRGAAVSRGVAIAAALVAAALYTEVPAATTAAVRCALSPAHLSSSPTARIPKEPGPLPNDFPRYGTAATKAALVALPLEILGVPEGPMARYAELSLEIRTPRGENYAADVLWPVYVSAAVPFRASFWWPKESGAPTYQALRLDPAIYAHIKDEPVSIEGKIMAEIHQRGEAARMPAGASVDAPALGKCSSTEVQGNFFMLDNLRVNCESPDRIPYPTLVTLSSAKTAGEWNRSLGNSSALILAPGNTWLSPLNRRDTFFGIATEERRDTSLVPPEALATGKLELQPEPVTGYATIHYEWAGVTLSKFVVPPAR